MLKTKKLLRRVLALALCLALLLPLGLSAFAEGEGQTAYVNDDGVRVRTGPGTTYDMVYTSGGSILYLNYGQVLTITGDPQSDARGSINNKTGVPYLWYPVTFECQGATYSGWFREDYMTFPSGGGDPDTPPNDDFETQLAQFPEDYKAALIALHEQHPSWRFEAIHTGLDWNEVQKNENVKKRSLIQGVSASWLSTENACYDWWTDTFFPLEAGVWYQAAPAVVAYYMDPRNFLNESDIFQFEQHSYNPAVQTRAGVDGMLQGSFMATTLTPDVQGNMITYTEAFLRAAESHNVSPYFLVARCLKEIGRDGKAAGTRGNYPGYEGIYNYFSIGAYTGAEDGLYYASQNDPSTYRPWNTPFLAILGGAQTLSSGYFDRGQDTPYFQKFAVVGPDLYWHQYMANIGSALSEGRMHRSNYISLGMLETAFTFRIPVYLNVPETPCQPPEPAGSPNRFLSSLSVDGFEFTPGFDSFNVLDYYLTVPAGTSAITVRASAISATATISGDVGVVPLHDGQNTLMVRCTAANGDVRDYFIYVNVPSSVVRRVSIQLETDRLEVDRGGQFTVRAVITENTVGFHTLGAALNAGDGIHLVSMENGTVAPFLEVDRMTFESYYGTDITNIGLLGEFTFEVSSDHPAGEFPLRLSATDLKTAAGDAVECDGASLTITVRNNLTGLSFREPEGTVYTAAGANTLVLNATVLPQGADESGLVWTVEDGSVAQVTASGATATIVGLREGKTQITVSLPGTGLSATYQLTVLCSHEYVREMRQETLVTPATCALPAVYRESCHLCGVIHPTNTFVDPGGAVDPDAHGENLELVGAVAATEEEEGYTGDEICHDCGKITKKGRTIPRVGSVAYGDANGDGLIDGQDIILIKQYLAAFDYTSGKSDVFTTTGADVNGDGTIDGQDIILLKQYLAAFDYEKGSSDVPLGPR